MRGDAAMAMNMGLLPRRFLLCCIVPAMLVAGTAGSPALAHKGHHKKPAEAANGVGPSAQPSPATVAQGGPSATHSQIGEAMEADEDRSDMSTFDRLLDWLGRLHPIIVHFPLAFFPAALFTAIVGRRRPAFAAPVQFLVIAGGVIAPIAAVLGWLDAINADPDSLLMVHRWLGTAIGVGGLGLGVWAWRRPEENRGTAMLIGLIIVTAAIIIQGWFGGAMVHGMDHLNW
jgi:uncharacterized membrane protein